LVAGAQHDNGLDDLAAFLVGHADHAALGRYGLLQQRLFDFRRRERVKVGAMLR
jgi:hypothetical protein